VLGWGITWRIEEITTNRVLVSPAPGLPGKMPFWRGEAASARGERSSSAGAWGRWRASCASCRAAPDARCWSTVTS